MAIAWNSAVTLEYPIPFLGGAVGYFGYETGHLLEDLPDRAEDDLDLPDIYLMFFNSVLVHCHETGKTFLSCRGCGERRWKRSRLRTFLKR